MKHQELLQIDVRLLIARYGRVASLAAMAQALNRTEGELQEDLRKFIEYVPTKKKRARVFEVANLKISDPNALEYLLALEARYANRTFLPELKDVNRFLDRHGVRAPKLKSRDVGKKRVFETLARLTNAELKLLASAKEGGSGFSSLGIISDQILNRRNEN